MLTVEDVTAVDSVLEDIRESNPRAAGILERLYAPQRAVATQEWLTTGEVAAYLGVSRQTVRNWVDAGWLASARRAPFGRRMIDATSLADVGKFRASQKRQTQTAPPITEEQAVEAVRAIRNETAHAEVGGGTR